MLKGKKQTSQHHATRSSHKNDDGAPAIELEMQGLIKGCSFLSGTSCIFTVYSAFVLDYNNVSLTTQASLYIYIYYQLIPQHSSGMSNAINVVGEVAVSNNSLSLNGSARASSPLIVGVLSWIIDVRRNVLALLYCRNRWKTVDIDALLPCSSLCGKIQYPMFWQQHWLKDFVLVSIFFLLKLQVDCSVRIEQQMQPHTTMTATPTATSASTLSDNTGNGSSASLLPRSCQRLRLSSLTAAFRSQTHKPADSRLKRKEEHRIVMMGSAKVGKSSIISQFLYDKYLTRYRQTVEELHRGEYELPDGASLTLDILDTSGAFQFPAMRALSISTSGAFILVYAVDDADTWTEVVRLREQVCGRE